MNSAMNEPSEEELLLWQKEHPEKFDEFLISIGVEPCWYERAKLQEEYRKKEREVMRVMGKQHISSRL